VCHAELEQHLQVNDKTVAEYIIARFEKSANAAEFKVTLKGDGIEGNIVERLWQLISHLKVRHVALPLLSAQRAACITVLFLSVQYGT
jgi:hypothetical protein